MAAVMGEYMMPVGDPDAQPGQPPADDGAGRVNGGTAAAAAAAEGEGEGEKERVAAMPEDQFLSDGPKRVRALLMSLQFQQHQAVSLFKTKGGAAARSLMARVVTKIHQSTHRLQLLTTTEINRLDVVVTPAGVERTEPAADSPVEVVEENEESEEVDQPPAFMQHEEAVSEGIDVSADDEADQEYESYVEEA